MGSFLVVVLLGAGGAWWVHRQPVPSGPVEQAAPEASARAPQASAPVPTAPSWRRAWRPGQQYVYGLEFEQRITLKPEQSGRPAGKEPASTLRSVLGAELAATVVERGADRIFVQYQLRPTALSFESGGRESLDERSRAMMLASLQTPFYVSFNAQGAAVGVHLEKGVDLMSQNVVRSVVASLQVVTPPQEEARWPSQELDTTGQFEAVYQRLKGPREFEKKKLRYRMMATPEGLRPLGADARITVDGGATLVLDEDLWVESLSGQERVDVEPGQDVAPVVGEAQVRLRLRERRMVPLLVGAFTANKSRLYASALSVQTVVPEDPKAQLRRTLAGGTLKSLTSELRALPKDEDKRGLATAELMQRLRALFLLEPDSAAQVPELIRAERSRNVFSSMIGSLSAASTPEAVRALAEVSADKALPLPIRVDAIAGLGVVEAPTPEGVDELRRLSRDSQQDVRNTATLALGNSARSLNQGGDPAGEAIVRELEQSFRGESDPLKQTFLLKSLANTADVRALPAIEAGLRSDSWMVREAAVSALRLIPDPTADRLLTERMLGDASPEVRRGAVFASSFRDLRILVPVMAQALRSDREAAVRGDIVRLLGERRHREPMAMELLAWASHNDPSAEIRHVAGSFLAPPSPQP